MIAAPASPKCAAVSAVSPLEQLPWAALAARDLERWGIVAGELAASPDLGPAWSAALVEAHGIPASELFVLRTPAAADAWAFWPCRLDRRRVKGIELRVLSPLHGVFALHGGILSTASLQEMTAKLLSTALALPNAWDILELSPCVSGSAESEGWLAAAQRLGLAVRSTPTEDPPYMVVTSGWEDLLAAKSNNFRYELRRRAKRLASAGEHSVRWARRPEEVPGYLLALDRIEARTWKHREGTSIAARPWERLFHQRLAEHHSARGEWLGLVHELDGVPFAHAFVIATHRRHYLLKHSSDEAYDRFGVGKLLYADVIRNAIEHDALEIDFLGRNERHKEEWATGIRQHQTVQIFRRGLRGSAAYLAARLASAIRRAPAIPSP